MLRNAALDIVENVWPMIFITSIIVVSLRITYLLKFKKNFVLYKELLSFSFVIYVICLFYVVTFQDVTWSTSNFVPFKEITRYEFLSDLFIKNVFGNILIFMPFGFLTSYFLELKKPLIVFILSIVTSLSIEYTQLIIGRVFDIDDIILNIVGGLIGFLFYKFIIYISDRLPKCLRSNWFCNIIVIIFLSLMIMYFY